MSFGEAARHFRATSLPEDGVHFLLIMVPHFQTPLSLPKSRTPE